MRLLLTKTVDAAFGELELLNHVCMPPEINEPSDMIRLAKALLKRGTAIISMFFHSPTPLEDYSPFTRTPAGIDAFISGTETLLDFAESADLRSSRSDLSAKAVGLTSIRILLPNDGI